MEEQFYESANPFKALSSYSSSPTDIENFKGRENEARQLFRLIEQNNLVLVYGESGVGKTSLINARVLPSLGKSFFAVRIKINYAGTIVSIIEEILIALSNSSGRIYWYAEEQLVPFNRNKLSFEIKEKAIGLWEFLHRIYVANDDDRNRQRLLPVFKQVVVIFDQFEELFTIGRSWAQRNDLINNIINITENYISSDLIGSKTKLDFPFSEQRTRIILCFREDYLPDFWDKFSAISARKRGEMRLYPFNEAQALEVMSVATSFNDINVRDTILGFFTSDLNKLGCEVEPSILSLLCYRFFEVLRAKGAKNDRKLIVEQSKDAILVDFYNDGLRALEHDIETGRRLVEDRLLTNEGYRTPYFIGGSGRLDKIVEILEKERIVRVVMIEQSKHIEIIHDILVPAISASKRNYQEQEKIAALKRENRNSRNKVIALFSSISLLALLFLAYNIYNQNKLNIRKNNSIREFQKGIDLSALDPVQSISKMVSAYDWFAFPEIINGLYKVYSDNPLYKIVFKAKGKIFSADVLPHGRGFIVTEGKRILQVDLAGHSTLVGEHNAKVMCVSVSPTANNVVASDEAGVIRVWSLETHRTADSIIIAPVAGNYCPVLFINDSVFIYSAKMNNKWLLVARTMTRNIMDTMIAHRDIVTSLTRLNNICEFISTSYDSTAAIWSYPFKRLKHYSHKDRVECAAVSKELNLIVTGCDDHTFSMFTIDGRLIGTFKGPNAVPVNIRFLSSEKSIIITYYDASSIIWRQDGSKVSTLLGHRAEVINAFEVEGKVYTFSQDSTIRKWDNLEYFFNENYDAHDRVNCARFSPNSRFLLIASGDRLLMIDRTTGAEVATVNANQQEVVFVAWSPTGDTLISAGRDNSLKFWDQTLNPISVNGAHSHSLHSDGLLFCDWTIAGSYILTSSRDHSAKLFDLSSNKILNFKGHTDRVYSLRMLPNHQGFLTCSKDQTAIWWDNKGKEIQKFPFKDKVRSCDASPDGKYFVFAVWGENALLLYNLETKDWTHLTGHKQLISWVSFSPDSKKIISGDVANSAIIWDLDGHIIKNIDYHTGQVTYCEFDKTGRYFLISGLDSKVSVWKELPDIKISKDRLDIQF